MNFELWFAQYAVWERDSIMAEGEEKLLAEFHGVKHKKQDGILLLTSVRVAWSAEDQGEFKVNHPYPQIKGTKLASYIY